MQKHKARVVEILKVHLRLSRQSSGDRQLRRVACGWRFEPIQSAVSNPIAERRPLHLQKLRGLRLVAMARSQGPPNQTALDFTEPIVE